MVSGGDVLPKNGVQKANGAAACSATEVQVPKEITKGELAVLRPMGIEPREIKDGYCFPPSLGVLDGVTNRDELGNSQCELLLLVAGIKDGPQKCKTIKKAVEGKIARATLEIAAKNEKITKMLEPRSCSTSGATVIPKGEPFRELDYVALVEKMHIAKSKLHITDTEYGLDEKDQAMLEQNKRPSRRVELCYIPQAELADRRLVERLKAKPGGCEDVLNSIKSENVEEKCKALVDVVENKAKKTFWQNALTRGEYALYAIGGGMAFFIGGDIWARVKHGTTLPKLIAEKLRRNGGPKGPKPPSAPASEGLPTGKPAGAPSSSGASERTAMKPKVETSYPTRIVIDRSRPATGWDKAWIVIGASLLTIFGARAASRQMMQRGFAPANGVVGGSYVGSPESVSDWQG